MWLAAPQVLVRKLPERRGFLLALDVVCGIVARVDAREHFAGAVAGPGELHLSVPGDAGGPVSLAGEDGRTVAWEPGRIATLEALGEDRAEASEAGAGLDVETSREGPEPGTGSARESEKIPEPKTADRDLGL